MKGGSFCDHFFPLGGQPWFFGGGDLVDETRVEIFPLSKGDGDLGPIGP